MSRKKIGRIIIRIFNAVMILGMVIPALYFLYHFIIKVMDNLDIKYAFVVAVFSAWHSMSVLEERTLLYCNIPHILCAPIFA